MAGIGRPREGRCRLTGHSTRIRTGKAPRAVRGSIRLPAPHRCVPVNSNVRPHAAPTDHMRKSLVLRAVALLGALLLSFVAGVVGGAWRGWLQPVATVTIVNQTGQQIEKLSVAHQSSSSAGTVTLAPLAPGQRSVARFYLSGEGSYTISAVLADGSALKEQEGYVEPGYSMTEILTPTGSSPSVQYGQVAR